MCTLIVGVDRPEPGSLLLAANRDESPERPADGPRVLRATPRLVGGRDRRAGGTWLAIREHRCASAILNRRPAPGSANVSRRPSRGLLALSVAAAGSGHPAECAAAARLWLRADDYAPCSIVVAGPEGTFVVNHAGPGDTSLEALEPGWHVITHEDLDDPNEPRTAALLGELGDWRPHSMDEGFDRLGALLARNDGPAPVCLHEGPMVTVSTARVGWDGDSVRFLHGEGFACRAKLEDYSSLLGPRAAGRRTS